MTSCVCLRHGVLSEKEIRIELLSNSSFNKLFVTRKEWFLPSFCGCSHKKSMYSCICAYIYACACFITTFCKIL